MYEKKEFTLTKINSIGSFEIRLKVARLENPSETIKKSDKDSKLENKFWETANNSKNKKLHSCKPLNIVLSTVKKNLIPHKLFHIMFFIKNTFFGDGPQKGYCWSNVFLADSSLI